MKSNNSLLVSSLLFLVFAFAFSIVIWPDASLSAKIAFFAVGFGSGISAGLWLARRKG